MIRNFIAKCYPLGEFLAIHLCIFLTIYVMKYPFHQKHLITIYS